MDWSNRFPLGGFTVSYSTYPSIQEVLKKYPQLEAHETQSFCLKKINEVFEQKSEKILRRRNCVNKWWDYLQTVSQEKVPSMLLQEIVFSQNRKSSGVTVGMMRSLNTKKKITNSRVINPKDRKIIFLNDKRI